jgi:hypothetical protein
LPGLDALVDALLLVGLALVDVGRTGLRQNRQGKGGENSDQQGGCTISFVAPRIWNGTAPCAE